MDTNRDIYGNPNRDPLSDAFDHAYIHQHQHRDENGNEYTYSHSHLYGDAHEHPDTAFNAVRPADADTV